MLITYGTYTFSISWGVFYLSYLGYILQKNDYTISGLLDLFARREVQIATGIVFRQSSRIFPQDMRINLYAFQKTLPDYPVFLAVPRRYFPQGVYFFLKKKVFFLCL